MAGVSSRDRAVLPQTGRTEDGLRAEPLASPLGEPPAGGASPGGVLGVLRRRKWWILQALVVVPLLVGLATSRQEKEYTATAGLLFRDPPTSVLNPSFADPTRQAATNSSLVVLPTIAARAAELAGPGYTGSEVESAVTVEPAGDSDVVDITAASTDPARAAAMANAYGEAYIAFRSEIDRRQLAGAIAEVRSSLERLSDEELAGQAGQSLRTQLDELELASSLANGNASLVQEAGVPEDPSSPQLGRNIVLGIVLGGLVGLGLAFARERFDQSLRSPEELEAVYGAPVLGRIPSSRRIGRLDDPEAGDVEPFRTLRANLRYFAVTRNLRSILVSSPMSGDGKSTIALNLARTMAAMGDDVVLVEGDLHKPSAFGHSAGLSEVLTGAPLRTTLHEERVPAAGEEERHLSILPAGRMPPNPSELLESDRMLQILDELEREFQHVIIDSPALTQVSDSSALVGRVSGVLVVSAVGRTRRATSVQFRKQVALLGGHVLGVVANRVSAADHAAYSGYGKEYGGRR